MRKATETTIKMLMEELNLNSESVSYGSPRSVLGHLNDPVIAYGIGYAGFLVIYKDTHEIPRAMSYSAKGYGANWYDCGFMEIGIDKAVEMIQTNRFLVEKDCDMDRVKDALALKDKNVPCYGEIIAEYTDTYYSGNVKTYREVLTLHKNKSGSYFAVLRDSSGTKKLVWKEAAETITKYMKGKSDSDYRKREYKIIADSLEKEHKEKLLMKFMMEKV